MKKITRTAIFAFTVVVLSGCIPKSTVNTFLYGKPPTGIEIGSLISLEHKFSPDKASFVAGFSKKIITPKNTHWLGGYYPPRLGFLTHDDLWARCLAIEDYRGNAVGIISLDLIGLLPTDIRDIEERIVGKLEVIGGFMGKLLVHTTHTHSAPDTMGLWGPQIELLQFPLASGRNEDYIKFVKKEAVSCFQEAWFNRDRAMLFFAESKLTGVADGPHIHHPDGSITYEIPPDETLSLMRIVTRKKSVVLINYALHPDLLQTSYVSADWVYYLYDFFMKKVYSEVMFVNGAIGDVQPKGVEFMEKSKRWQWAKEIGVRMAEKTLEALQEEKLSVKDRIDWHGMFVGVTPENKRFIKAAEWGIIPDQRGSDGKIPVELNYVLVGDAGIITYPGEVFPNLAIPLKGKLADRYKFTFGLINGELGYVLTPEDFHSQKYPYHNRTSVSPTVGDEIHRAVEKLILKQIRP